MPDYMYLLESRLSPEQRAALERVQELSRAQDLNVYLTGGAVRDLISGQPIRDLDFTIEGNPVKIVRELEKGGAKTLHESERLRHYEIFFAGEADGSISAARDDVYERPGTKPEIHFAGIMEDLRRRDFSINAIAISLNAQSRGLLLDPTNGLADLERQEVRALINHSFTNQPIRLMRILRYCARMGFKMEQRTHEWFDLAFERGLQKNLEGHDVGGEIRAVAREDNPVATLKEWESRELLAAANPQLQKRKPDYDSLNKLSKIRMNFNGVGIRPRLQTANTFYLFSRLKPREASSAMKDLDFRAAEIDAVAKLVPETQKVLHVLKGRKMNAARDAYAYLASLPSETLAFIEVEMPNPAAVSRIRAYVQKWRPIRLSLPANELDALGVQRGPKFDKILEQLFEAQLRGKGKTPEDRTKLLRQYAGIKEDPKKKPEKEKKGKGKDAPAVAAPPAPPAAKGKSPAKPGAPGPAAEGKSPANALGAKPASGATSGAKAPPPPSTKSAHKPAAPAPAHKSKPPKQKNSH